VQVGDSAAADAYDVRAFVRVGGPAAVCTTAVHSTAAQMSHGGPDETTRWTVNIGSETRDNRLVLAFAQRTKAGEHLAAYEATVHGENLPVGRRLIGSALDSVPCYAALARPG
jgi:hypothetical protein